MKLLTQTKYGAIALALTSVLVTPAFAKHNQNANQHIDKAKVISVTPTYERVKVSEPYTECWQTQSYSHSNPGRYSENRYRNMSEYRNQNDDAAAPIIGAVIGGVIGNQFGKGKGKPVATIAGAIIGGTLANEAAANHQYERNNSYNYAGNRHDRYNDYDRHHKPERHSKEVCKTSYRDTKTVNELTGYDVSYRYKGEIYYTHTRQHPGKFIDVSVVVTPLR